MRLVPFCLTLLTSFLVHTLPAEASSIDSVVEHYHNSKAAKERLHILIDAVDKKIIYKGLEISDVDRILLSKFKSRLPRKGYLETGVRSLTSEPHSWYFSISWESTGLLKRYALSDCDSKDIPCATEVPSTEAISFLTKRYQSAQTEEEKLAACIDLLDKRAIYYQIPSESFSKIFGSAWRGEELAGGGTGYSIPLSEHVNGWRLCFFVSSNHITDFFLTNLDDYFDGDRETWWPKGLGK